MALFDDIAALAKVAAASIDDAAARPSGPASRPPVSSSTIPRSHPAMSWASAARELPIVAKIALGSIRNKLLFLAGGADPQSFLPRAITPLLMTAARISA